MAEETWHAARLIPTSGIKGAEEQERRATSALLAVLTAVKEFGRTITGRVGAPAGAIEGFVEVPFELDDHVVIPDGVIRVRRGKTQWTCLVEVKTGGNLLERAQLEAYLDVAREHGFDSVLTISNEIPPVRGLHPTEVDKRKLKKVQLHHLSWTQILTDAVTEKIHRGVADPDQAWILGELIRYLEHPRSGAMEFDDMGPHWVAVRDAVRASTLRSGDKGPHDVAARWDQLVRYASLRLGRELGTEVQVGKRKELADPTERLNQLVTSLASEGRLQGTLKIADTVGPITLEADLRAGQLMATVSLDAPKEGRAQTRVNWLLRQLKQSPDSLRIEARVAHQRGGTAALLREVRLDQTVILSDPKRDIRSFTVTLATKAGTKRGGGRGGFVTSVLDLLDEFYATTVQNLRTWSAPAPRLRKPPPPDVDGQELTSTSLSSQDGPVDHWQPATQDSQKAAPPPSATPSDPASQRSSSIADEDAISGTPE
jgi:hypothetical protein